MSNLKSQNIEVLWSFVKFCLRNHDLRFWQALRAWAGVNFVYTSSKVLTKDAQDTYYWEGRDA